jgi:hypothetical protein
MKYRLIFLCIVFPCLIFSQTKNLSDKNPAAASSTLPKSKAANYEALNAIDCNFSTAWVEGVKGSGIGEWIEIYLGRVENLLPLTELDIEVHAGYKKSYSSFEDNGLPSSFMAEIYIDNEKVSSKKIEEIDGELMGGLRNFSMDLTGVKKSTGDIKLKITILKARKGKKYDDTAISEILCNFKNSNPYNIKADLKKFSDLINKKDKKNLKIFSNIRPESILDQFINPFAEKTEPECDEAVFTVQSDRKVLLKAKVLGDSEVFAVFEHENNKWLLTGFMSTPAF